MSAASKSLPRKVAVVESSGKPTQPSLGKADDIGEVNRLMHPMGPPGQGTRQPRKDSQNNVEKIRAAMLVAVLAGESPAGGNCSVAAVVISGSGASDQAAGSPEVKVSVGWRETFGQLRQGGERVGRL